MHYACILVIVELLRRLSKPSSGEKNNLVTSKFVKLLQLYLKPL